MGSGTARDPKHDGLNKPDAELLRIRLCDLALRIEDSEIGPLIEQLWRELGERGLKFRPQCYLSTEWFVEQGETCIGIPFFLAHPKLMRLERRQVLDVEGASADEAMRILRHEAGHAVDYAYRMKRSRGRREIFGSSSTPYPENYTPRPHSHGFVRHLDNWYAQSHPDEDFAETFAVWLTPHSAWGERYRNWKGALRKLQWMDARMTKLRGQDVRVQSGAMPHAIAADQRTLQDFYDQRLAALAEETSPEYVDGDLRKIFAGRSGNPSAEKAADYIRKNRKRLREVVARWSGLKKYNVDHMLSAMTATCRELDLVRTAPEDATLSDLAACCVALSKNYLFAGRFSMSS